MPKHKSPFNYNRQSQHIVQATISASNRELARSSDAVTPIRSRMASAAAKNPPAKKMKLDDGRIQVGRICYYEQGTNGLKKSKWEAIYASPVSKIINIGPQPLSKSTGRRSVGVLISVEYMLELKLRRGGHVVLYPSLLNEEQAAIIAEEAMESGFFRRYNIQCTFEPRLHYLLHDNATDDFEQAQPGYRYGNLTMKARPLHKCPQLQKLAQAISQYVEVPTFNIGADVVLYRAGSDSIGKHADDTQGEECVFSVIVQSPDEARRIRIEPKLAVGEVPQIGDEVIELFMGLGDGYCMDRGMQERYLHSVPKSVATSQRMAIIFRHGREEIYSKDSGEAVTDISPCLPTQEYMFGNSVEGLKRSSLYTRVELVQLGIHRAMQRGISGNMTVGCDAIIVSGQSEGDGIVDQFSTLVYSATRRNGALSLLRSYDDKKPIRVLRSSTYDSKYQATRPEGYLDQALYRYDGLYRITGYRHCSDNPLYYFTLHKLSEVMSSIAEQNSESYLMEDSSFDFPPFQEIYEI